MITPEMIAAKERLAKMEDDIARAEANMRVAKNAGLPTVEAESKLIAAKQERQKVLDSIRQEELNGPQGG